MEKASVDVTEFRAAAVVVVGGGDEIVGSPSFPPEKEISCIFLKLLLCKDVGAGGDGGGCSLRGHRRRKKSPRDKKLFYFKPAAIEAATDR